MCSAVGVGMLRSSLITHVIVDHLVGGYAPATVMAESVINLRKMKETKLMATILGIISLYVAFYFALYWVTDYCLRHYL